jgi:hypothetical protein
LKPPHSDLLKKANVRLIFVEIDKILVPVNRGPLMCESPAPQLSMQKCHLTSQGIGKALNKKSWKSDLEEQITKIEEKIKELPGYYELAATPKMQELALESGERWQKILTRTEKRRSLMVDLNEKCHDDKKNPDPLTTEILKKTLPNWEKNGMIPSQEQKP